MISKKKVISLIAVVAMAISTLSGCAGGSKGKDNTNSQGNAGSDGTSKTTKVDISKYQPDAAKTYTISWLVSQPNAPTDNDAPMKQYWEKKYNVKFDLWYVDRSKWNELLNVRFASGAFPDVLHCTDTTTLKSYYDQNLLMEVPVDLIQSMMPKIYANIQAGEEKEGVTPWIVTRINGKNYGIPKFSESGDYPYTSIWREDWLNNVGITKIPETLQEFEDAFYKFVNNDPDKNGKKDTYALSSGRVIEPFASIYGAFGYIPFYWADKDGGLVYGAVQPEMKQALTYLAKWYKDGLINPEFITGENKGGHWSISNDFVNNAIGYTNNGPFYTDMPKGNSTYNQPKGGKMTQAFDAAHKSDGAKMTVGKAPVGPNGKSGSIRWGLLPGTSLVFSKKLESQPDKTGKIMQLIDDLCSDYDNFMVANYGIKDVDYSMKADGTIQSKHPEDQPLEKYGLNMVFQAYTGLFGFDRKMDPQYFAYADKVASYTKNYTNRLYTTLPSQDKYWDDLDKLQKETYIQIITGAKPISYFDEFVTQWKSRGGDQLTKEATEWYKANTKK